MGTIGMPEMFAIFFIALLLFGPKKLPELGRLLGKGMREFKRAKSELTATFQTHMQEIEREVEAEKRKDSANTPAYLSTPAPTSYTPYSADSYPYEPEPSSYEAAAPAELPAPEPANPVPSADVSPSAYPVHGAVPRSNGVHPVSAPAEEEQRA